MPRRRQLRLETGAKPTRDQELRIEQLDETRSLRLEPALRDRWLPSQTLREYETAIAEPHTQRSTTVVRLIEDAHVDGWTGRHFDPKDGPETAALRKLRQLIRDTRHARVPDELREALVTVEEARGVLGRTMELQKVNFA